jgi:hypothetical protein
MQRHSAWKISYNDRWAKKKKLHNKNHAGRVSVDKSDVSNVKKNSKTR